MIQVEQNKITSFTQLRTWQKSKEYAVIMYRLTADFPKEERYSLSSQIRRAATSIPANIAEGFSRSSAKDKSHYYVMALDSLTETMSHLYITYDLGYINQDNINNLENETTNISKMLNGMIKSAKSKGVNT